MIRVFAIAITAIAATTSPTATAQLLTDPSYQLHSSGLNTSVTYPACSPNAPQFHASTLEEGVLRGTASVMQAYYNGQLTLAQARILLAEARAREAQLRVVKVAAAQDRRRLVAAERADLRQQQLEADLLSQQLDMAHMPLRYAKYRLDAHEFDRPTGEIRWPLALEHPMFAGCTNELDGLFFELAATEGSDARYLQSRIAAVCEQLQSQLRKIRAEIDLNAEQNERYFACHNYILGLKYEAICGGSAGAAFSLAAQ